MDKQQILLKQREIGAKVGSIIDSEGYLLIAEELKAKIEELTDRISLSNDPNEVFACVKEKNGLLFFIETANRLIEDGVNADRKLAQQSSL